MEVSKGHRQSAVVLAGMVELFKLYSGRERDVLTDLGRGKPAIPAPLWATMPTCPAILLRRIETHGSSYSLPPPSTFRFDRIFQCEQFDTELSALWGPHAAARLCDHGGSNGLC